MGNSEVGHLNIGAGRVVYQDFTRIDQAIATGEFARNPVLADAVAAAKSGGGALHVFGLVSPGGVHSHERQIAAMVELAAAGGAPRVLVHAFLDGRDTPPRSAAASLALHRRRVRPPPGRADRLDRRPLLRDGPGQALGPRARRLRPRRRRPRAVRRGERRRRPRRRLRPRRERRVRPGDRHRRRGRPAGGDGRRRRRRVHELPRRPRPRAHARADRSGVRRFRARARAAPRALRLPHELRRRVRATAGRVPAAVGGQRVRRMHLPAGPHAAAHRRDREVRARHLLLQRRRRDAVPGRGSHPGAVAARGDLRPAARDERPRGHRPAGRGDRVREVRRDRVQLRQRRHGRPHRQLRRRDHGHRDARRLRGPASSTRPAAPAARC